MSLLNLYAALSEMLNSWNSWSDFPQIYTLSNTSYIDSQYEHMALIIFSGCEFYKMMAQGIT